MKQERLTDAEYLKNLEYNEISPSSIVQQFGSWAVTKHGLESLGFFYPIAKTRLWDSYGDKKHGWDWERHMSHKQWVIQSDFKAALKAARDYHSRLAPATSKHQPKPVIIKAVRTPRPQQESFKHITPHVRFLVLKRDGYRCQICGATAQDGAHLQVDHKIPRAKGGLHVMTNLWTLCWECNIGKGTNDL